MAPLWPLTSAHLITASVYYLLDVSSFSLFSTLFLYFRIRGLVFSTYVSSDSSCTRAAVVATPQPTAIQQQHHNNSSRYILVHYYVRVDQRQRKQARMKEQVKCCREPAMYEYFMLLFSFFFLLLFRLRFIVRNANRQQQLIWIFPSTGDTQSCDGPPSKSYHF